MKLKEIGEFGFIDRVKDGCFIREKNVIKAIGDDCCVFRISGDMVTLLTTDMLVENIHFLRYPMSPYLLGRKALAVNISDIAAMGGIPREAVISIAIPDSIVVEYLDELYKGMKAIAREFDVNLLGGDTTASPEHLVVNVALVGEEAEDEVLYRSGAKVGDVIFLTGPVGDSAVGLDVLLAKRGLDDHEELLNAHYNPYPHVKAGRIIAGLKIANSMIDVSDGVASDLGHICSESKVGAIIEEDKIPVTERFNKYWQKFGLNFEYLTLHVGEDYVLLGTVPEKFSDNLENTLKAGNCNYFPIGKIVEGSGIKLKTTHGLLKETNSRGWDHFKGKEDKIT
jgi:thiamine-monophosphate kinase